MRILSYLLFILLVATISCDQKVVPADMVIFGGKIYTVNDAQPEVEAVAIQDDKIVFAGSEADVRKRIGKHTQVIDLEGRTMIPGFIEGHGHFMGIGYNALNLDLMDARSYEEIVQRVADAVSKAAPGQWILGRGWHQDKWDSLPSKMVKGFQTHEMLSAVSPDNPVFLSHASGHAAFANARAMEIAGVNQLSTEKLGTEEVVGGEIFRDEMGNPTGIFNERAQGLIRKFIPDNTPEKDAQALEMAVKICSSNGITSFHDAGEGANEIALFRNAKKDGSLKVRLYVMVSGGDPKLVYNWLAKGPEIDTTHMLTIRSIKLHCDGALGSWGAWLLEPYSDKPDAYGHETLPMDTVLKISREALKAGFQVCSHAIGDRANREVLDRYEQALKENPVKDHRFRIEHAQHLHPDDIPRFAQLGVIPAFQAIHLSSDRPWAIERLGEKRIVEGAYMWQTILKSGAPIVNGTDAPVEPVNPIPSFFASVTRQTLKGQPEGGYESAEKMTRKQALRSYTLDAAYGAFEEDIKGSIEVGKLADFAILSRDIMTVPDSEILGTEVEMTILGGKVVFNKNK